MSNPTESSLLAAPMIIEQNPLQRRAAANPTSLRVTLRCHSAPTKVALPTLSTWHKRKAAENNHRFNAKAELEIELLLERIDQLRAQKVLRLTDPVKGLTDASAVALGIRRRSAQLGRLPCPIASGSARPLINRLFYEEGNPSSTVPRGVAAPR
jgi:hypothetical protein